MSDYYLAHHGVPGMKWGVRKARGSSSSGKRSRSSPLKKINRVLVKRKKEKIKKKNAKKTEKAQKKAELKKRMKPVSKMSDAELRRRIGRKKLEQEYKKLNRETMSEGQKVARDILKGASKNVGEQLAVYVMGEMVNKAAKKKIVNPKKGQS